jgi:hypothetical protein
MRYTSISLVLSAGLLVLSVPVPITNINTGPDSSSLNAKFGPGLTGLRINANHGPEGGGFDLNGGPDDKSGLNINLGDHSPAVVVGDGKLSFSGTEPITNIIHSLQGAAISSGPQG